MSSRSELDRRAFHRRQMDALPTLISGLDPDPPVLLCPRTEKFDELVCQELRAAGWPASSKSEQARKAHPPTPIKGAVLSRKLAKGNHLTDSDVRLLTERIAWMQRNWFRWSARSGYDQLAASKSQGPTFPTTAENVGQTPPEGTGGGKKVPYREAEADPRWDLFQGTPPRTDADRRESRTAGTQENSSSIFAAETGNVDGGEDMSGGSMDSLKGPAEVSQKEASLDRLDAALASLNNLANSEDVPSFEEYAKAIGEGGSDETNDHLISLRTTHIRGVDGDKVQTFLLAIHDNNPRIEIERRARALAADKAQLSGALSRGDSTSQDIREAFAKLGLDADA